MSCELAALLVYLRNKYNYPKAYLIASNVPTKIKIASNFWAQQIIAQHGAKSDLVVDRHHHKLLHSISSEDNILGTTSVIFWGFNTFSKNASMSEPKFALNRIKWHLEGNRTKSASTPEAINQALNKVKTATNAGEALSQLSPISQLGRSPFASKVIAFMFPETTGVYDTQIMRGLYQADWAKKAGLQCKTGDVSNASIQKGYTRWCNFLTEIASSMNKGIERGNKWQWTDPGGQIERWRAIDIERALFHLFKNKIDFNSETLKCEISQINS